MSRILQTSDGHKKMQQTTKKISLCPFSVPQDRQTITNLDVGCSPSVKGGSTPKPCHNLFSSSRVAKHRSRSYLEQRTEKICGPIWQKRHFRNLHQAPPPGTLTGTVLRGIQMDLPPAPPSQVGHPTVFRPSRKATWSQRPCTDIVLFAAPFLSENIALFSGKKKTELPENWRGGVRREKLHTYSPPAAKRKGQQTHRNLGGRPPPRPDCG